MPLKASNPQFFSRVLSLGAAHAEEVVTNDEVCQWIDSSDDWIQTRTGIRSRRRAGARTSVLDLALQASREAVEGSGVDAEHVDAVILATTTSPYATPSLAARLADQLGATPAAAYDISASGAGFTYALMQADALVRSGVAANVLVVGAEKLSDFIDRTERTVSFELGDGAGAAVIGRSAEPGIAPGIWGSDGSQWNAIGMTHSLLHVRDRDREGRPVAAEEKIWPTLRQDGPAVFRWTTWEMAKAARRAIEAAGLEPSELAAFVPQQSNLRAIAQISKALKLPEEVLVAQDLVEEGNTASASVPMAAHRLLQEHPELSGHPALFLGYGAGLVYAAQVVLLP